MLKRNLNKTSVLIFIPTYNSDQNILGLIKKILKQNITGFKVKVLVYSDCSSDNTYKEAAKAKNHKLIVIDGKERLGFGAVVRKFLKENKDDVFIILNDDIKITDNKLIIRLVTALKKSSRIGLVSGNTQPISDNNFFSKAIESSFRAYEKMYTSYRSGNSIFSCDGKILALSKEFIKTIKYPKNTKYMGNVDSFLYLSCIKNGFKYKYVNNAIVFYKNPDNFNDYLIWTLRNNTGATLLKKQFGNLVDKETTLPKSVYYYEFIEFLKNPFGSLFLLAVKVYVKIKARSANEWFTPTWDVVSSTKVKLS